MIAQLTVVLNEVNDKVDLELQAGFELGILFCQPPCCWMTGICHHILLQTDILIITHPHLWLFVLGFWVKQDQDSCQSLMGVAADLRVIECCYYCVWFVLEPHVPEPATFCINVVKVDRHAGWSPNLHLAKDRLRGLVSKISSLH